MVAEIPYMLVWGFFSAMGWMTANWTVEKVFPDSPAQIEKKIENVEKKLDTIEKKIEDNKNETK